MVLYICKTFKGGEKGTSMKKRVTLKQSLRPDHHDPPVPVQGRSPPEGTLGPGIPGSGKRF